MNNKDWGFVRNMQNSWEGFPGGASGKEPTCPFRRLEMRVWSLGREDLLEKELAIHSSILAWRTPWTEEAGGLQSLGSQRVRHVWSAWAQQHPSLVLNSPCCLFLALSDKSIPYPTMPPSWTITQQFSEHENIFSLSTRLYGLLLRENSQD